MLDHRMRRVAAELADDAQQDRPRLRAATGKLDLALAGVGFDAVEPFEEVIVPGNAAKLAIGDRLEPDLLLSADDVFDLAILDVLKGLGRNLAARALLARRFQGCRPQQTADMIGAKRRLGALDVTHLTVMAGLVPASRSVSSVPTYAGSPGHVAEAPAR